MKSEPNSVKEDEADIKSSPSPICSFFPQWVIFIFLGGLIRVAFKIVFGDILMRRVELVNPLTSWFRMKECIALSELSILPYSGDICHHPPLVIYLFQCIGKSYPFLVFIIADLLIAIVLYFTAKAFTSIQLQTQSEKKSTYAADTGVLLLGNSQLKTIPCMVISFYLFNPCAILTCHAQSAEVFNNLAMAMVLLTTVKEWYITACLFISVSSYLSLYPMMMLVPVCMHAICYSSTRRYSISKCLILCIMCVIFLTGLMASSYQIYKSWDFIHAVYGFILQAPDLTPNMGLFWYLFAEMFDHFRLFYLWVYQINVFIYVVPIAIIFRKHPMMVFYIMISLMAIFKSYSNVGSMAVSFALLPLWSYAFRYMRNILLVTVFLILSLVLAPGMWYLWIYAGSGNVNFFYAVTLAYATGQIFLISDVLYALLRHEYHLFHGFVLKTEDGEEGTPILR